MAAAAALLAGVALAACAGIFAGGEGALASEVPLVAAADALGPAAGAAYSAAVVAAIYTTAVGYLMGIGEVASGKIGRGAAAAAACAGAFAAAQAGFSQLVRSVFPAAGALGLALVGWAFWRAAARHLAGLSDRAVRRLEAAVSPGLKRRLERVLEALADRPAHSYPQVSRLVVTAGSLAWLVGAQIMKPEGVNLPAAWWVWSWGMAYCVLMWLVHRWLARSFLRGGAYLFGFVMDIVFACLAVWATGGVRSWFFPMAYLCVINSAVYFGARGAVVTAALAAAGYAAAALAGSGWRASAFEALTLLALVVPYFFYFGTYTAGEAESEKAQRTLRKRFAALYGLSRRTAENPDPDEARAVIQGILREHLEALDISVVLSAERPVGPAPEDVEREIVVVERGGVWSAAAPMAAGKDRFGVLAVSCGRKPEPDELELVAMLANHMGLVLKNRQMLDELKALAYTDALTGLANHRRFQEKLAEEAERSRRYGSPFSLLLVDIDHFKKFNDTYGHRFGDLALREVAQALRRALRGADFAARYGGEELAVILPETDLAGACAVAERICREVRSLDLFDPETGARARVTVSVGVAEFAGDRERLVREADAALYAAKRAGRDTWRAFRREATECGAAV
jgi:diguanylate cyclase (GGDEF)-like protein